MSNPIHTEVREGFTIQFFAEDEYMALYQMHFEPEDIEDLSKKLDSGELVLFSAKVTASRNGVELASENLGGCIYKDEQEFVNNSDYYADMVATVIEEAKQALADLTKEDEQEIYSKSESRLNGLYWAETDNGNMLCFKTEDELYVFLNNQGDE